MHDNEIFLTKLEITLEPKKKEKKIFDDEENFPETDSNELMNQDEHCNQTIQILHFFAR